VGITERGGRGLSGGLIPGSFEGDLKPLFPPIVVELDCCRLCERLKFMRCERETFRPQIQPKRTKEG
jgi:hypothetical protein